VLLGADNIDAEYQIEANPIGQIRLRQRSNPDAEWL